MPKLIKLKSDKRVYSYSVEECGDHTNYYINGTELPKELFDSYFEVIETPEHYLALLIQEGEGCDYTIACGLDWFDFNAMGFDEAVQTLKDKLIGKFDGYDYDGEYGIRELKSVKLVEVAAVWDLPIKHWYEEAERIEDEAVAKRISDKERAEYERLKKKFKED